MDSACPEPQRSTVQAKVAGLHVWPRNVFTNHTCLGKTILHSTSTCNCTSNNDSNGNSNSNRTVIVTGTVTVTVAAITKIRVIVILKN